MNALAINLRLAAWLCALNARLPMGEQKETETPDASTAALTLRSAHRIVRGTG